MLPCSATIRSLVNQERNQDLYFCECGSNCSPETVTDSHYYSWVSNFASSGNDIYHFMLSPGAIEMADPCD